MANKALVTLEALKTIITAFKENILEEVKSEAVQTVVEPAKDDVPSLFITGTMPTEKIYVPVSLEYVSETDNFSAYTYAKLQGTSTLAWPKKNFTIALFEDEARTVALNKNFKGWGKSNKFVLKADYNDITHARNVVCAKLWSKVVASRPDYDSLPEGLKNSPNNGAIDGFPVKVYINGEYHGLYALTIPKGAWQFGLNKNNPNHALISAQINDNGDNALERNPCNFFLPWTDDGDYPDAWEIEVGTDRHTIQNSFNNAQHEVALEYIGTYLDYQSAIDYCIFQEVILGTDGLAKNMLMVTYDMTKWYLSAYDMDSTFDLSWEGNLLNAYDTDMPDEPYENRGSLLINVVRYYNSTNVRSRYWELRKTVLSEASIISEFENYINIYGDDLYIQDTIPYPNIPNVTTNTLDHLKEFVRMRLEYLDDEYGGD